MRVKKYFLERFLKLSFVLFLCFVLFHFSLFFAVFVFHVCGLVFITSRKILVMERDTRLMLKDQ